MKTFVAAGRRGVPRGWGELPKTLAIWFGFLLACQATASGPVVFGVRRPAPRRMFQAFGFDAPLPQFASLNHGSGLVNFVANPYAAMPSLHAADALIVGLVLFAVCRNVFAKAIWLIWPGWVWFSVMATGNHFWLDVLAGVFVALVALAVVYGRPLRRLRLQPDAA